MQTIISSIQGVFQNIQAVLVGILTSIIGYFIPVRDIVHLLVLFFMIDVIFGYWAAKKLRNERFSVKIIWQHTIPRMLISIVLIIGAFMWDNVYSQDYVSTYKIVGWFISGVLLYSIAENGYHITKWSVFPRVGNYLKEKTNFENINKGVDYEHEHEQDKQNSDTLLCDEGE